MGTGLGSIFSFFSPAKKAEVSFVSAERRMRGCPSQRYNSYNYAAESRTPMAILFQPNRRYTADALENRTEGVVTLLVEFRADGTAKVIDRIATLPDGLTEEAERIVERTKFTPATLNGVPVTETKEMNYYFYLSDRATVGR
jgi:hypothetical protein